tara:strand:- start:626 stop:1411 length:786 start_codon:yes stop_codon:yes gene_type:complete
MSGFLSRIFHQAFAPSIRVVDAVGILVPPAAGGFYWVTGADVPDGLGEALGVWVMGGAAMVLVLRLVTAPYFVWRVDQKEIRELKGKLNDPSRIRAERKLDLMLEERERLIIFLTNVESDYQGLKSVHDVRLKYRGEMGPLMSRFQSEGLILGDKYTLLIALEGLATAHADYVSGVMDAHVKYVYAHLAAGIARDTILDELSDDFEVSGNSIIEFGRRIGALNRAMSEFQAGEDGEYLITRFMNLDREVSPTDITALPQQH